jgi:hypothetical protein
MVPRIIIAIFPRSRLLKLRRNESGQLKRDSFLSPKALQEECKQPL